MSKQITRGTKRICQSATCALPFYDLNRADIWCPNCRTAFDTSVVLHARRDDIAATPSKRAGRGAHDFSAARPSEATPIPPQAEEDDDTLSTPDETIDADADTLPLDDESDDEIADVVTTPEDDQSDR